MGDAPVDVASVRTEGLIPTPEAVPGLSASTGSLRALEVALVEAVASAKSTDPLRAVRILVAETLLRPYLRRRLALELDGHVNVHIITAGELGLALGESEMLARGEEPLPFLGDRILA